MRQFKFKGRVLWELFVTIHPVLERALPEKANQRRGLNLKTKNNIAKLRDRILTIFLNFPGADIDKAKLEDTDFSQALVVLLGVLETLVDRQVLRIKGDQPSLSEDSHEQAEVRNLNK